MKINILIAAIVVLLLNAGAAAASETSNSKGYHYWFELGLLGGSLSREFDGNGMVQKLSISKNRTILSLRNLYHNNGANLFKCVGRALILSSCRGPTIEFMDQALLVGRRLDNENLSFSVGLGRLDANYHETPTKNYSVNGIALDIDWRFVESRWIGLSVNVSGNINKKNSILGAYLTFIVGKLR
ncbi:MAG: hypothetical protein P8173_03455 [Gammaproteobacteria bacterium]|jgi:hypothetical protein